MKRYMLFGSATYYPEGGMADLLFHSDSLDEVRSTLTRTPSPVREAPLRSIAGMEFEPWIFTPDDNLTLGWWHIWDTVFNRIVARHTGGAGNLDQAVCKIDNLPPLTE